MRTFTGALCRPILKRPFLVGGIIIGLIALAGLGLFVHEKYHFDRAERALAEDRLDDARRHALACDRFWRRSGHSLLAAQIARLSSKYEEAAEHLTEYQRRANETTERGQLEWVLLRAQRGEINDVESGLWLCLQEEHPDTSRILEALARGYMSATRLQPALKCLDLLVEREPASPRALEWRAWVVERLYSPKHALPDYEKVVELYPERFAPRLRLAELLVAQNTPSEAVPHLERLMRAQPDNPEVLLIFALCRMLQGADQEAETRRLLDSAREALPQDARPIYYLGKLELDLNRAALAEPLLRKAAILDPQNQAILEDLARAVQLQGSKRAGEAKEIRAQAARLRGDAVRLEELLQKHGEKARTEPDLAWEIGDTLLRLGQERPAFYWLYHVALTLDRHHQKSHESLIRYYELKKNQEKVAEHRRLLAESRSQEKR
jgi:predicted Zn-dependent protease